MRKFLLLIFILSFTYAIACEGSIVMELPAVSEGETVQNGEMVSVRMHLVPGEGNAYVRAYPSTDSSLQESLELSRAVAESLAGEKNSCDVLLEIIDDSDYVQGPSGGAAFSLMEYSLFSGKKIRTDAAITGGVNELGGITPVGGLYEKAVSARAAGKKYFLTPMHGVDEYLLLSNMEGIKIYQVASIEEAAEFFFAGKTPKEKPLNLTVEPLPEIAEYGGENSPEFRRITERMIEREGKAVAGIKDAALREYFGEKILQQRELLEKGYYYSAANEAFLGYVLADSLSRIEEPDVEGKIDEVGLCIEGIEKAPLTYENYGWVMGAEARLKRAEGQLGKYLEITPGTKEEEYYIIYELDYALAWCDAASDMYAIAAETGGTPMEEGILKENAEMLLGISGNYSEIESSENYRYGKEMLGEGKYAGAVYELMYALAFERMDAERNISVEGIAEVNEGERSTLWGRIFKAHSYYLVEAGDLEGAYAVAVFSNGMEELDGEVEKKRKLAVFEFPEEVAGLEEEEVEAGDGTGAQECPECPECPEPVCAAAFILLVLPLFIKNLSSK